MHPPGNKRAAFEALLHGPHVSEATRKALKEKLEGSKSGGYFNDAQLQTLRAVANRLIPQDPPQISGNLWVNLPAALDDQLAVGKGKGWRYDILPPDSVLFKKGMEQIESAAQASYKQAFTALSDSEKDAVLTLFQEGKAALSDWSGEMQKRFFEELLAALTSIYYSHPAGRAEIGDLSFADLPHWEAIGLNATEPPKNQRVL